MRVQFPPLRLVSMEDKYQQARGRVIMTGIQALVRLPMLQRERDRAAGLNTAGFISGYRGSPLGGYDLELWKAKKHLEANDILFQPGVNEDLAATAVWGTQTLNPLHHPNKDGIFAIWYGKGPGVDRSLDPIRHGNIGGTHPHGGVLLVAGDDHAGKSSSIAHQSETAFMHAGIPVLAPSSIQEVLEYGLLGIAMSRYTGLYTGFKVCNELVEQTATVELPDLDALPSIPDKGELPAIGIYNRPSDRDRIQSEMVVKRYRTPLIAKFVRANGLDRTVLASPHPRLGILTAGKAYYDVVQALRLLELEGDAAAALGITVHKLGCIFPLEPDGLADFAGPLEEMLVIEEKNPVIENQAKTLLYGKSGMPRIVGKVDPEGKPLIPSDIQLEPIRLAVTIARRLNALGLADNVMRARAAMLERRATESKALTSSDLVRAPYFCSGCPHNTGTRFPDGSLAAGGIGCHAMAMHSGPEMLTTTHMGGEGGHWYSVGHFSNVPHIFQNMGDGTYYHSGLLAIRGAIAAKVNITFKILYNDAVAMTGGQPVDGPLSPGDISRQLVAEGVRKCVLVTDRPELYKISLAEGVSVHHRDNYDEVQREIAKEAGVTAIIYEQTCAAEKRRRRKRGKFPDPAKRMFINSAVCEGCGDCSVKSNCVSVWPKETELGRKRQIDQSSCNKDYSCVKGFCPSFVTVLDAQPRKPAAADLAGSGMATLPSPAIVDVDDKAFNLIISGIGGTGVVTIGALLGMAAHLEQRSCSIFDMTGLSVKNGAVYSHLRIGRADAELGSPKLGVAEADLALAFDIVAALSSEPAVTYSTDRTSIVANSYLVPVAAFQRNPDLALDSGAAIRDLKQRGLEFDVVDATGLGEALLGDSIAANLFMLGYAAQKGKLPVSVASIERAIELNAVAVPFNKQAFGLGRFYAVNPEAILKTVNSEADAPPRRLTAFAEIRAHRISLLTDYQNVDWADRYARLVDMVAQAEQEVRPGSERLATTVARTFAKLMSYKDEYEVARLHLSTDFTRDLECAFESGAKLRYNLAPPIMSRRDPRTGELQKREFGSWVRVVFRLLAPLKRLRGTSLDIFGYTAERKSERALIDQYERLASRVVATLTPDNLNLAVGILGAAEKVRGFGHVKERNLEEYRTREADLLAGYEGRSKEQEAELEEYA